MSHSISGRGSVEVSARRGSLVVARRVKGLTSKALRWSDQPAVSLRLALRCVAALRSW